MCCGTTSVFLCKKCQIILLGLPRYKQGIHFPIFWGINFPIFWGIQFSVDRGTGDKWSFQPGWWVLDQD